MQSLEGICPIINWKKSSYTYVWFDSYSSFTGEQWGRGKKTINRCLYTSLQAQKKARESIYQTCQGQKAHPFWSLPFSPILNCRYLINTPCLSKWLPSGEGILRMEGGTYYFVYSSLRCLTCYNKCVYLCITFLKPNSTHSHTGANQVSDHSSPK